MGRAGNKAFDRCDVKQVEFIDFVYTDRSKVEKVVSDEPSRDTRQFAGNGAVLHCPRTEDNPLNIESQFTDHPNRKGALTVYESWQANSFAARVGFPP